MKFFLPKTATFALLAAAKEDGRFSLQAARVNVVSPEEVEVVCTDGHILSRAYFTQPTKCPAEPGEPVLIRAETLTRVLALAGNIPGADFLKGVVFDHVKEPATLTALTGLGALTVNDWTVHGQFPSYLDVIPEAKVKADAAGRFGFGGRLMERVSRVLKCATTRDADTVECFSSSKGKGPLLLRAKGCDARVEVVWMPVALEDLAA